MSRHYSPRDFFRNTPNALLARYFAAREVFQDFDFGAIKETKIEPLFVAWMALPEAQRAKMEVDLREIGDMSNEKGVMAIIDEALFHMDEETEHPAFVALLMALPGHHDRAMTAFLDYPKLWKGATRLYHADTLSFWRKRKNLPKIKAGIEPANVAALEEGIRRYYRALDGRAKHCQVETYRRGDLEYFFAFPQDFPLNAPSTGEAHALRNPSGPQVRADVGDAAETQGTARRAGIAGVTGNLFCKSQPWRHGEGEPLRGGWARGCRGAPWQMRSSAARAAAGRPAGRAGLNATLRESARIDT